MVLYYILLPLAWLVFHIGFRVECVGRENLKKGQTGGCILARAGDFVWVRGGVSLNPPYRYIGNLFGSEFWI